MNISQWGRMDKCLPISRILLISSIISFIMIILGLISLVVTPTQGYEVSIYDSTPIIFWVAVILGLFNAVLVLSYSMDRELKTKFIVIAIMQIILCNILLLSLYALRGYIYLERGDTLSYIGLSVDILNYGNFGRNFYPVFSILITDISLLTDVSIIQVSKYLTALFYFLYMLSIYCLSKHIISKRSYITASIIASTPLFFAWFYTTVYYMLLSMLLLPLFLYIIFRLKSKGFTIIGIIFCSIFSISHPIIAMLSLILLLAIIIYFWYHKESSTRKIQIFFVLISTILFGWYLVQLILLKNVAALVSQFLGQVETPSTAEAATYYLTNIDLITTIRTAILLLTDEIIYFCLIVILSLFLIKIRVTNRNLKVTLLCFIVVNIVVLGLFFLAKLHTPIRLINLNPAMTLAPLLVGYLLFSTTHLRLKKYRLFLICMILIATTTCIFSLYQSPLTYRPTDHVTLSEEKGFTWMFSSKVNWISTADVSTPAERYADMILGYTEQHKRLDLKRDFQFQNHFGISNDLVIPVDRDRYFIVSKYDIQAYAYVWKDLNKYSHDDFTKIDICRNVDKIYSNKEFSIYLLRKKYLM